MNYQAEYYSGQGKVFVAPIVDGKTGAFRFVGNVPALSLETSVEKNEHKESHTGTRAVDKVIISEQNVEVSFTLEDVNIDNLALAFHGEIIDVAGESITDAVLGELTKGDNWVLTHQNVSDVVINDKNSQPLVVDVDYILDKTFGRITFISDSQTLKQPFTVSYTAGTAKQVKFLKKSNPEYALRFEGLNTAENNKPVLVQIHKMAIEPASTFDLINDELGQFEVTGKALMTNEGLVTISKL
ncbi:hypothetical protein [Moraxella bovis]|uniref:phage tail tube protein n=1 Tax=Moraxella bovis TaxID=476 RepID=UPI0022271C38|nr:hypothetical protein [Moraxella bovis]UZA39150.1 hypothetical protein LP101_06315 [Moraxella bovis]